MHSSLIFDYSFQIRISQINFYYTEISPPFLAKPNVQDEICCIGLSSPDFIVLSDDKVQDGVV